MINEVKGDLIKMFENKQFDAIIHGCNCCHQMGAGIARTIALRHPKAIRVDQEKTVLGDYQKLGTFSVANTKFGKVINLYTQLLPGNNFEYAALVKGLHRINKHYKGKKVGIPQIGAGIGGGNWAIIKKIIYDMMPDVELTIVHYDTGTDSLGNKNPDLFS
jgi:O-acetyl-ADP-ribose deacetylase (regulator of RNase III)